MIILLTALARLGLESQAEAATGLQAQVDAAAPGSVIILPAGHYGGLVDINKSLILQGAGAGVTVLDGKGTNTVLIIRPGTTVAINDLTVTGGSDKGFGQDEAFGGGGIKNFGNLTLNRCRVENNVAGNGTDGAGRGGGILSRSLDNRPASLLLNACRIHSNRVIEGAGGGLYNGPGVAATLNHCAISKNSASFEYGGGIFGGEPLILNNCTVSENTTYSRGGAGLYADGMILNHCTITANLSVNGGKGAGVSGSVAECQNTIIAGNWDRMGNWEPEPSDCKDTIITSRGNNLIGDGTGCVIVPAAGDQIGTASNPIDPKLGPLGDNGGFTETHALLPGSPAIDRGSQGNLPMDQRGADRPFDFPSLRNTADGSDIGAFERVDGALSLNQGPSISRIYDHCALSGASSEPIFFSVDDAETRAEHLALSSRFEVVDGNTPSPLLDIVLGGSGKARTVTVISPSPWIGTVRIILTVRDEEGAMAESPFLVNLLKFNQAKATAPQSILIVDNEPVPAASITLNGLEGVIKTVHVTLRNLTYRYPGNLWLLLVNPSGRGVVLMSQAGNGYAMNSVALRFDDAGTILPKSSAILSGTYRPTAYDQTIPWPLEVRMKEAWLSRLWMLNGSNPNGTWSLYLYDASGHADGVLEGGWSLEVVTQPNTPPTLSPAPIPDQVVGRNMVSDLLLFTIGDRETAAQFLTVSVSGDNPELTPWFALRLGGSGGERTLVIKPAADLTGSSRVQIKVSDGFETVASSFNLAVIDTPNRTFSNNSSIRIPALGTPDNYYPILLTVSEMTDPIQDIKVLLNLVSHTWPADLNVLLEGPGGRKAMLMGKAGYRYPLQDVSLQFQDSAAASLPQSSQIHSGVFTPTRFGTAHSFPAPAPPLPYGTSLSVFKGTMPNGLWKVYVWDDSAGDEGRIGRGCDLTILTESAPVPGAVSFTNPAAINILDNQAAAPYPSSIHVSGLAGTISKATVTVRGLSHTWPGDILMLLVSPTGQKSYLMAKAGRKQSINNVTLQFDDAAALSLPFTDQIVSGAFKPTSYTTRSLLAPAPPRPYGTNLSIFNGASPNGSWALYVMDDCSLDQGMIAHGWSLDLALAPAKAGVLNVESGARWGSARSAQVTA